MALWTLEPCPVCEGSGMAFCSACEGACEHDALCPRCDGDECVPVKLDGWALYAASIIGGDVYPRRKDALAAADWRYR